MAVFEDIEKALIGIMIDNGSVDPDISFSLPIAYENVEYDDADGEPYLSIFILPAATVQSTLGDGGCDDHQGIFQIDIKYKTNQGIAVLTKKADEINAIIKSGATFTNNGLNVRIRNVSRERVTISDGYATLPMTIEYFVFSERL